MVAQDTAAPHTRILEETDRPRLVRLCARLSGRPEAAEDLAQETLLEAWRLRERLQDPAGYWPWLTAIARNVCLRGERRQGRRAAREAAPALPDELAGDGLPAADGAEVEHVLERQELIAFLDRALAALPPETRAVLVAKYVADWPQAEIARRLGLSEGAVEARLQRGKRALRALLGSDLRPEAESLGILLPPAAGWHQTRIWCPFCGAHPLLAQIEPAGGHLHYRCAGECMPSGTIVGGDSRPEAGALTSPKAILTRALLALHDHYERAAAAGGDSCANCGRPMPLRHFSAHDSGYAPGIEMRCPACGAGDNASLWHLALDTPAAQRFWRRHPRMRALPTQEIEHAGRRVVLGGFASRDGAARLIVLFDPARFHVLRAWDEP